MWDTGDVGETGSGIAIASGTGRGAGAGTGSVYELELCAPTSQERRGRGEPTACATGMPIAGSARA